MRPRVGLGVVIWSPDGRSILLHRRRGGHQPGRWCSPGGHLEYGESFEECAVREVLEECGPDLRITVPVLWDCVNTIYPEEDKHYVTIMMSAHHLGGEARVMEPDKCEVWEWHPWARLPEPLMLGNALLRERHPAGR